MSTSLTRPGYYGPRFDEKTGLYLAYTGAIKKEVYDTVQAGTSLCLFLAENYPENIVSRYTLPDIAGKDEHEILSGIAKSRGCIKSGGEIDTERAAIILLDEFRSGRLGNITLELPSDIQ
jgi:ribosome biogenesis GTPase A